MSSEANDGYDPKRNIDIAMIGPSGTGKTSLLATMNHTLAKALPSEFQFLPIRHDAHCTLDKKYNELSKLAKTPPKIALDTRGRQANHVIEEYSFGLDYIESSGAIKKLSRVTFFDTPGALTEQLSPDLTDRLERADIVICAIDAGVLVHSDDSRGNKLNSYANVHRLLNKHVFNVNPGKSKSHSAESRLPDNRLVLFVPIKAETWLRDNPDVLFNAFAEHYAASLKMFDNHGGKRVGAYIPVETLGCVRFARMEEDEQGEVYMTYIRDGSSGFSPRHVHVPLLYAIQFALAKHQAQKGTWEAIWDFFTGSAKGLIASMEKIEPEAELKSIVHKFGAESLLACE